MQAKRQAGISFVLRARNEEAYLRQNLESLRVLRIPHEIIVVLHLCTDGSRAIAVAAQERGQPIRIFEYTQPISRAGYENLITPATHPASMASYNTHCFAQAQFNWTFKWDADFTMAPSLANFLNTMLRLDEPQPMRYRLKCTLGEIGNDEFYLFNSLLRYGKYVFWEVPIFVSGTIDAAAPEDVHIVSIPPTILKNYWRAPPWFASADSDDARELQRRFQLLEALCEPEPMGSARCACSENSGPWHRVVAARAELEQHGIYWTE